MRCHPSPFLIAPWIVSIQSHSQVERRKVETYPLNTYERTSKRTLVSTNFVRSILFSRNLRDSGYYVWKYLRMVRDMVFLFFCNQNAIHFQVQIVHGEHERLARYGKWNLEREREREKNILIYVQSFAQGVMSFLIFPVLLNVLCSKHLICEKPFLKKKKEIEKKIV